VLERYGRLDILVNNAGAPAGGRPQRIEDVPVEAWDRTMGVNARGAFLMSRAARAGDAPGAMGPHRQRLVEGPPSGRVGIVPPMPHQGRDRRLHKSLAFDLAPFGITVNAVCPGPIRTSRAISTNRREYGDDLEVGFRERAKAIRRPLRSPDEVAAMNRLSRLGPGRLRHRPGDRHRRRLVRPVRPGMIQGRALGSAGSRGAAERLRHSGLCPGSPEDTWTWQVNRNYQRMARCLTDSLNNAPVALLVLSGAAADHEASTNSGGPIASS